VKIHLPYGQKSVDVHEGDIISFRWLDGLPDGSLVRLYGQDSKGNPYALMECQKGLWSRHGRSGRWIGLGSGPWRVVRLGHVGAKKDTDVNDENRKMQETRRDYAETNRRW